ncbi:protein SCO1/2 [Marisediminitalea aggregata]|uniref:Protein SCO1/2 n=1 Tax=Marisediminitalea aggregata TaxID=634436 RepID=A0A1M5FDM3_9ALTE|nr:SCO family protein [Marisediminitalea aggregata]BBO29942.1 electron transporter SenC [Alteromonas sp. I4]SHF89635.1 protein SCO1/2 [Marisediminitalea aggregata]
MSQKIWIVLAGIVALSAGAFVAVVKPFQPSTPTPEYFQYFPEPRNLADISLVDQTNTSVDNTVFNGRWSLLFLGYTYCPDICPTTMASLGRVYPELKKIGSDNAVQVVFVSVDPNRDTPERLASYVEYFNAEFVALTGEHAQLFPFVRSLGLMYAIAESTDNPNYLVDHSASVVVVDPQGRALGRFKPKYTPGELAVSDSMQIAKDLPLIIGNYKNN